jgi:hypothetical protein
VANHSSYCFDKLQSKIENGEIEHRSAMFQVNVISSVINFVSLKQISDKFNRFFNDLDNFNWKNKHYLEKSDSIEKGKQNPYFGFVQLITIRLRID